MLNMCCYVLTKQKEGSADSRLGLSMDHAGLSWYLVYSIMLVFN